MNYLKKYDFLTPDECDKIIEIILSKENQIKQLGPDNYPGTNTNSLTGRYYCFNFLSIESINSIIAPKLKEIFGPCTVQCWANTFRRGEGIAEHTHVTERTACPEYYASANIFLCGDPTIGTYYEGVKHESKPGQLTIFPPNMLHGVIKNPTDKIRISMAFDIYIGSEKYMKMRALKEPWRYIFIK
jgi:hypothetical protein